MNKYAAYLLLVLTILCWFAQIFILIKVSKIEALMNEPNVVEIQYE